MIYLIVIIHQIELSIKDFFLTENYKQVLLARFRNKTHIARTFRMELSFDEKDRGIITMPYNPDLDHGERGIHGGIVATLLDTVGWFTCALAHGGPVITTEMSLYFLQKAASTELKARGDILNLGRKQVICKMQCWDEEGILISYGTGTFLIISSIDKLNEKKKI